MTWQSLPLMQEELLPSPSMLPSRLFKLACLQGISQGKVRIMTVAEWESALTALLQAGDVMSFTVFATLYLVQVFRKPEFNSVNMTKLQSDVNTEMS